jgi:predicted ATPase/DNA-binding XRE family transcriptional regulator
MRAGVAGSFGAQLKALREAAGFTQDELATIAGLSVHAVSALERGERRRPQLETVRALSAALDLTGPARDAFIASARTPADANAVEELSSVALPLALTTLLGRDADVRALREWLADPTARLVTLLGPGGVGKTRLALDVARAIADESPTRVLFVPLAATRDSQVAAGAIAEALGLADISASDLPRRARAACDGRSTLMVLDNVEQVADAAPLVGDLLTSAASLRLLVTSRAPLHVRGEREYALSPLALAAHPALMPADLARVAAVRLFLQRVRDVLPDFQLTTRNGPVIAAICRRLDGLPLALELVAPWLKTLTAEDVLRRLEDGVLLSTVGRRDLPERQQTMNATVAWSYQLLDAHQQRAFRRLGVLPGRFSIEAAAAILTDNGSGAAAVDEALTTAASLIDKSLLLRVEPSAASHPLYQMLETVRAYATVALTERGEREQAMEGLVRHCTREAALAAEGLAGSSQAEWLDRVRDDLDNYRSALEWLVEHDRPEDAIEIAWALWPFWFIRGYAAEGRTWYEKTLSLPSPSPAAESRALVGAGLMCYSQGELALARTRLNRALAVARAVEDREIIALAENLSGRVEHAFGDVATARRQFAGSVEKYRALSIKWGIGSALAGMAGVAMTAGDFAEAERLLDEATAELRHTGPWFQTLSLNVRALFAVRRRQPDQAIVLVRESITLLREVQDKISFVHGMAILAAAARLTDDAAWVARISGAGDAVTERTGATVGDKAVDDLRREAEHHARAALGPARWEQAYAAGRTATIDALLKDIDRALARR